MQPYEVILHAQAWGMLATARESDKGRLLRLLDEIKIAPFRSGDYRQPDETGRMNEVALLDDWLVTFWSDHAVRKIHLVSLERVED
ncbi:MAG TPA: hypothetical protein VK785_08350 [Opitutaceae bacterium]|nr:hypothetical protein [Opitutaceae bacterium]